MKELLGNISFWIGLSLGSLTILDFILRDNQKKWISSKAELLWLWLDEQKAGRFTILFLNKKVQNGLVYFTHLGILSILISFVGRIYFGWNVNANLQLGHPRAYEFQVWIDILALVVSILLISKFLHPRLLKKLKIEPTIKSYLLKSLLGLILCFGGLLIILLIESPIIWPLFDLESTSDIETYFGGKYVIIILHLLTAIISAPIMAETFLFQFMFFIGLYWTIIVYSMIFLFRFLQFFLIRIAENPKGPVIALSGLLTGIGAIVKLFMT